MTVDPHSEETLSLCERVLGLEHPKTLLSRKKLADDYGILGRHDEADALDCGQS